MYAAVGRSNWLSTFECVVVYASDRYPLSELMDILTANMRDKSDQQMIQCSSSHVRELLSFLSVCLPILLQEGSSSFDWGSQHEIGNVVGVDKQDLQQRTSTGKKDEKIIQFRFLLHCREKEDQQQQQQLQKN